MTDTTGNRMISMRATNKPFHIDKRLVYEAYKAVKSNRGAAGVDEQTIEQFEADSQGTSPVHGWDYLKAKSGGLFAEAHLGAPERLFLALVEHILVVGFLGAQKMIDDAR
jgi:hypothetical protein